MVSVIILNYKNWREAIDCLQSVFASDYRDFRVYVVDNDSKNNSLEEMENWIGAQPAGLIPRPHQLTRDEFSAIGDQEKLPQLVFVQNPENAGFAAGNNVVLRSLVGTKGYVWLLNPDVAVDAGAMSALVSFSDAHPRNAVIGPVIRYAAKPEEVYIYGGARIHFHSGTVQVLKTAAELDGLDYIAGGALFTRAAQFGDLGLLPEKYFLYWEEADWCYAAKLKGCPMLVCEQAICYDKIGTTIGRGFLAFFYYTRNGLLFVRKFKKKYLPMVISMTTARYAVALLSGRFDRARGISRGALAFMKMRHRED